MKTIIDDEDYPMTPDTVLILRNVGPQGGSGMPEWGMVPMPKALLKLSQCDMVRLSDARMSGTSFGACVLHVAPESYVGGPLALIKNGEIISLDIPNRSLKVELSDVELAIRKVAWVAPNQNTSAVAAICLANISYMQMQVAISIS